MLAEIEAKLEGYEDEVVCLVLAACESQAELDAMLGSIGARASKPSRPPPRASTLATSAAGAFLESVRVEGFRGVGDRVTLEIAPGPGLTLVVGRNGCGKSSIAEGLEVLLTGASARIGSNKELRTTWRNLHSDDTRLSATLTLEGRGRVSAERSWVASSADLDGGKLQVRDASSGGVSVQALGWDAVDRFRPFLSYAELGKLAMDSSAEVYDALAEPLGTKAIVEARKRLQDAYSAREKARKTLKIEAEALKQALEAHDDPRAKTAADAMVALGTEKTPKPDLDAFEKVVLGDADADDGSLAKLDVVVRAVVKPAAEWDAMITAWEVALSEVQRLEGLAIAGHAQLSEVLSRALEYLEGAHALSDDCPVCERPLDGDTVSTMKRRAQEARELAGEFHTAKQRLAMSQRDIETAKRSVPLDAATRASEAGLGDDARAACELLTNASEPDELRAAAVSVESTMMRARDDARAQLDVRRASFRPLQKRVSAFVDAARIVDAAHESRRALNRAVSAMKDAEQQMRAELFAPIESKVRSLWERLGRGSDVELVGVALQSTGTRRHLALDSRVGDKDAPARAVMSQGELSALALALFLPRTSLAGSPFRFVIIDDPVQAMDPIRVDALAEILDEAAKDRQVLVFTHDERLADAVRRMRLRARIVRVDRRGNSRVELHECPSPARAHINDAKAVCRSEVSQELKRRVVPVFCRSALEAAAVERFTRAELRNGSAAHEVGAKLDAAKTAMQTLALGLFGDSERSGEVFRHLNAKSRSYTDCLKKCQEGAHDVGANDLESLVEDAERFAQWLTRTDLDVSST